MGLTDEQWAVMEPLIWEEERKPSGTGPPWRDARDVTNGILCILRTGAPGKIRPIAIRRPEPVIASPSSGLTQVYLTI